jgi:hypothetical protein
VKKDTTRTSGNPESRRDGRITEEVGSLGITIGYGIDRESVFAGGRSDYTCGVEAAVC